MCPNQLDQQSDEARAEQKALAKHQEHLKLLYPWGEDRLREQLEARDMLIVNLSSQIKVNHPNAFNGKHWDQKEGKYV